MDESIKARPAHVSRGLVITGHGHVKPRADGAKARCGGPGMGCPTCLQEQASLPIDLGEFDPAKPVEVGRVQFTPFKPFKAMFPLDYKGLPGSERFKVSPPVKPKMRKVGGWWFCGSKTTHETAALDAHKCYALWLKKNGIAAP